MNGEAEYRRGRGRLGGVGEGRDGDTGEGGKVGDGRGRIR